MPDKTGLVDSSQSSSEQQDEERKSNNNNNNNNNNNTKNPFSNLFSIFQPDPDTFQPSKEEIREAGFLIHTDEDVNDTLCGIGSFKPRWLQVLARKEAYLAVFCMVGLAQGMFFTYTVSVISTLEKRFKLTSKQTGAVLCGNDISQVILSMVLGYYGNYGHRPRWVGIGVMFAALSCFVAAIPHFLYGPGSDAISIMETLSGSIKRAHGNNVTGIDTSATKVEMCYSGSQAECGEDSDEITSYMGPVILFFFSQFFVGIAVSLFYSIGITYMDDNVSKKSYPLYYSSALLLRILGPVLGYLVGGKCLSMWIDPFQSPNLTMRDPRWLGAWWLGYMFIGTGLTVAGSLLFLFPRNLPGTLRREAKRIVRQTSRDSQKSGHGRPLEYFASLAKTRKNEADRPNLNNLRAALKRLFTNKIWVGNLFNTVVAVLAFSGYWNFKPKYLENQFRKSAAEANYYTGVASLASVVMGTGVGGFIMRWIRPRPRYVAGYNIFVTLFLAAGFLGLMFIGCPKLNVIGPVAGSTVPECSSDCECSPRYSPMCSQDQSTVYYSPCYAGCTFVDPSASPVVYSGCKCIAENSTSPLTFSTSTAFPHDTTVQVGESEGGWGMSGYCPEPCDRFFHYLIVQITVKTVSSTGRVGSSVIHLRSVRDEDKGLALGTLTLFMSFFAFIPAPIIMGAIIDSACLVWDESCGVTGNCWLYDSDKFRTIIHLVPAVLVLISVLGDFVVYYYSCQLDLYGDREDQLGEELPQKTTTTTQDMKEEEEVKPLNTHKEEDFLVE